MFRGTPGFDGKSYQDGREKDHKPGCSQEDTVLKIKWKKPGLGQRGDYF